MERPIPMPASTDLDDITYLGRLSEALSMRIEEQTRPLFDEAGITVPVRSCSCLLYTSHIHG